MEIKQTGMAGTLESSDVQITVSPATNGIHFDLTSDVIKLFGEQIKATVSEVLSKYEIANADVQIIDKGALDLVIKARAITAVERALALTEPRWEVL